MKEEEEYDEEEKKKEDKEEKNKRGEVLSFFWLNQSEKEKKAIEKKRICKDQGARLRVWILGKEKKVLQRTPEKEGKNDHGKC